MNQWTVPLEWNGGMEYWNDPWSFFPEGSAIVLSLSGSIKVLLAVCQSDYTLHAELEKGSQVEQFVSPSSAKRLSEV